MGLFLWGRAWSYGRIGGNGDWGEGEKSGFKGPFAALRPLGEQGVGGARLGRGIRAVLSRSVCKHEMAAEAPSTFCRSVLRQQVGARVLATYSIFTG